jgi:hypothetical protein
MILEKQTEAHILQEGETQETVKMSLDLDSAQVLMQMLSKNLYSDAIGSTIRECASNALDSHRRAGSDKPIIVSFKRNQQADTYEFAVQDFGIGLDADDVRNIISKYGKSTKRDSNTELGMMGLGFKAPLAYSSSFYFVARKNGMERKYMMYEGEDTNSIDLLYEIPTTEENGVKIIVPVNYYDRHSFHSKIKEQLAYFEDVYFDVEPLGSYTVPNDFTIYRSEHFQFSSLAQNNEMHLCLDNVSYPIDWEKLGIDRIGIKLALRFSLNDGLFPTPNREAIRYTKEAKETILKKIASVADAWMEKFNEAITTKSDIKAIMEFYGRNHKYMKPWYNDPNQPEYEIDRLVQHSKIPVAQPKLEGIKLLDLQRLAISAKEYLLSEYKFKYRFSNGKFQNMKNYYYEHLRMSDISSYGFGGIYIYNHELPKSKQDYLRTILPGGNKQVYFVKKSPFKLRSKNSNDYSKYYYAILGLDKYPKSQWRQLITEFQHIVSLYSKDFIDADAIEIPQEYKDAQKAKRMKVAVTAIKGPKKVRMKGEFSGKVGTAMEVTLTDQYCKFVPTTFKMEDIHNVKKLHIYAKEADKKKMDALWSRGAHLVNFVLVAQATYDNLQKADLHNWITLDKFMEGKNRPFKVIATEFLIRDLIEKKSATFRRIHIVTDISVDLADKLHELKSYDDKNHRSYADRETMKAIILHATENRLFDEPIYTTYKQVCEVFTKLPFLDTLLDKTTYSTRSTTDAGIVQAIIDLFKYYKHRVNLEHYKLILTEDAPLEETLTEDTVEELETI